MSPFGVFFFCHFFLHKQKEMAHNLSGIYRRCGNPFSPKTGGHGGPPLRRQQAAALRQWVNPKHPPCHCEEAEGRRGNPFSPPGAIFFLRSQKEYGKKNLPREGLVETAPPLEPTPVCISSHRHMPGDAFAAYRGGTQVMLR